MIRLEMENCSRRRREVAKISALSFGKIDKYEYLTGEEILPPDKSRMIRKLCLLILL